MKDYINALYQNIDTKIFIRERISDTYGEVLFESVEKILGQVNLSPRDVIYDLGSGLGKILLQVALQASIKKIAGIECNKQITEQARQALHQLQQQSRYPLQTSNVELIEGDFLETEWNDATVVFIFSPCLSQPMLRGLASKINQIDSLHTVVSLKPIPMLELKFKKSFRVQCTWDSALCYLYSS